MSSNPNASTERQISHEKFGQLDENGDGFISKNEFRNSLKKQGLFKSEDAVDAAWSHFDKNTDGRISFGGKILFVIFFFLFRIFLYFVEFKKGIDSLNETPVVEQEQKPSYCLYSIFCCKKYKS